MDLDHVTFRSKYPPQTRGIVGVVISLTEVRRLDHTRAAVMDPLVTAEWAGTVLDLRRKTGRYNSKLRWGLMAHPHKMTIHHVQMVNVDTPVCY